MTGKGKSRSLVGQNSASLGMTALGCKATAELSACATGPERAKTAPAWKRNPAFATSRKFELIHYAGLVR